MARTFKDVTPFFAWHHKETGERFGWVFASRHMANKWMEENYWRYPKFRRIDDYFATLRSDGVRKFSAKYWYRDKNIRENHELRMGFLSYIKYQKPKSLNHWAKRAIKKTKDGKFHVKFSWKLGKWDLGEFDTEEEAREVLDKRLKYIGLRW